MCIRIIIAAALLLAAPAGAAETLVTVDGRTIQGDLAALDETEAAVRVGDGTQTVPRGDLLAVTFAAAPGEGPMTEAGRHVLVTDDGSRLAVSEVSIADGQLAATSAVAGRLTVPLERVVRLLRPRANERPAQVERALESLRIGREARPAGAGDTVIVAQKGGQFAPVAGIVKGLDARQLLFSYEGAEAAMDAASIVAIEMARVGAAPPTRAGRLVAADGSRFGFTSVELVAGTFRLVSPAFGKLTVPTGAIASATFPSDRVVYLSDLAAAQARQTGYLGDVFPYLKDRAADGGPLRLGGVRYDKGLGLHTRCELEFDLAGAYQRFVATAGIDDGSPLGSARLTILGDGRPLADPVRLDRKAGPQALRLDVAGIKRLTIVADFGDGGFGAGERVTLADARLIK